jgi:hypothetical protein
VSDVNPIPSTLDADEVRGVIIGTIELGREADRVDSFSEINCLFISISESSSKITVTTERPGID